MSAPVLTPIDPDELTETETADGTRSLVRLLAAAASVLLISFLVVNRSGDAFQGGTEASSRFQAGAVQLADDDTDRSLFDVPAMAPGQRYENCITVTYSGTLSRSTIELAAKATGELTRGMRMSLDVGRGGGFGDCGGFIPERTLYNGVLDAFAALHGPGDGLATFTTEGPGDSRTFRFGFQLAPDAAPGDAAGVDFDWSVGS